MPFWKLDVIWSVHLDWSGEKREVLARPAGKAVTESRRALANRGLWAESGLNLCHPNARCRAEPHQDQLPRDGEANTWAQPGSAPFPSCPLHYAPTPPGHMPQTSSHLQIQWDWHSAARPERSWEQESLQAQGAGTSPSHTANGAFSQSPNLLVSSMAFSIKLNAPRSTCITLCLCTDQVWVTGAPTRLCKAVTINQGLPEART